jgi:hypothetical protein
MWLDLQGLIQIGQLDFMKKKKYEKVTLMLMTDTK